MNWTGGAMTGSGITTISSGANLVISQTATKVIQQRTLNNLGTISWSGGQINGGLGTTWNNQAGALLDIQSDLPLVNPYSGSLTLNNAGLVKKSADHGPESN